MDSLNTFKNVSGLAPSLQKSTVFFCNVPNYIKQAIFCIMPFDEGRLPVRYLGVPLVSSRLLYKDCAILVEKMEKRIMDWKVKSLSFAGRLQLVILVLSSLHIYWTSVFILPARIVKDLEQKMRGFLWCQGPTQKGKAKVSWKSICVPKSEGGLGIRHINEMNKALMTKHIWSILTKRESLWVSWIHDYKLKGRSFWDVPIQQSSSWGWRKILQLRPAVRRNIWSKIGDGKKTSCWFDLWSSACPLRNFITPRDIHRAGFQLNSVVADVIHDGAWLWPDAWFDHFPILYTVPIPQLNPTRQDELCWKDNEDNEQVFSSRDVWESIRSRDQPVNWVKAVWFASCIPKHAFNLWLIMRRKLLTQDRILLWSPARRKDMNMMCCALCHADFDSHNHLFFECVYASQVLDYVWRFAELQPLGPHLNDILNWLVSHANSRRFTDVVGRLLVAAIAYYIWQERNNRLFKNVVRPPDVLCDIIIATVRAKLMTMKFKKTARVQGLLDAWKIVGDSVYQNG